MNKLTVCKDNRVIEAGYKLSKLEQCLILFAVAKNNPLKFQRKISFYVKEFIEMFPTFSEKNIYSQLKKAVDELYERSIVVNNPVSIKKFRWVSSAEYYTGEARIDVNFTEEIEPYLSDLNARFTQYKLFNVSKFKSDYSFRLYELFIQYLKIGTRDILIDDLRTMLIIGEKYKTNKSFNQLLIKPCVAEINKLSDLKISYVAIKKGVSIVGYKFTIKSNNQKKIELENVDKLALKDVLDIAQINAKIESEKEKLINTESYKIYEKILITFASFSNSNITLSDKEINLLNKFKRVYEQEKEIKFSSDKQKKYLMGVLDNKNSIQNTTKIQIRSRQKTLKKISDDIELKVGMILIGSITKNEYTIQDHLIIIGANYTRSTQDNLSIGVNDLVHIRELIDAKKLILKK